MHNDYVAADMREAGAKGRSFALVLRVANHAHVVHRLLQFGENLDGAVAAAVVNDNDFLGNGNRPHPLQQVGDPRLFIEHGNNDREFEAGGEGIDSQLAAGSFAEQAAQRAGAIVRLALQMAHEIVDGVAHVGVGQEYGGGGHDSSLNRRFLRAADYPGKRETGQVRPKVSDSSNESVLLHHSHDCEGAPAQDGASQLLIRIEMEYQLMVFSDIETV